MNLARVLEGECPTCGEPLERREDCGWCGTCQVGHSAVKKPDGTGTYTLHLKPRIPESFIPTPRSRAIAASDGSTRLEVVKYDQVAGWRIELTRPLQA